MLGPIFSSFPRLSSAAPSVPDVNLFFFLQVHSGEHGSAFPQRSFSSTRLRINRLYAPSVSVLSRHVTQPVGEVAPFVTVPSWASLEDLRNRPTSELPSGTESRSTPLPVNTSASLGRFFCPLSTSHDVAGGNIRPRPPPPSSS